MCPTIVGTRAKKKNQGSSCDEIEKTTTPTNKKIVKTGKADKIIEHVKITDAQNIFDELISPWQEMSRKYLEEVPDSSHKLLLEQVPMSFANELIASDKTKFHADVF